MTSPSRLRIAILVVDDRFGRPESAPRFGSAPTALLQGLAGLSEQVEVHVISCTNDGRAVKWQAMELGTFHSLPLPKVAFIHSLHLGCWIAVRRYLCALQPEVVHAMGTERWCAVAGTAGPWKRVLTMHGLLGNILPLSGLSESSYWRLQHWLESWCLPAYDRVICNSKHTECYVGTHTTRGVLIPHAVRSDFLTPPAVSSTRAWPPRILCVGTFYPLKRQLEVLRMAAELHRHGVQVVFRFLGDGGASDPYSMICREEMARGEALGYAENGGTVSSGEMIAEMDRASGLVHFSSEESFGLAVAEALARGLMVFTNAAGGLADVVEGVDGVVVLSSFNDLGPAITDWVERGAPHLPGGAVVMKTRFAPARVAALHLDLYRELLDERQVTTP